MAKVAVLVAVYNAQPYLRQCLDSLMAQTLTDFEAVCVDDCSTDGSATILEEYARRDARIRVVRLPENHGQAHARNVALRLTTAPLVAFLDSDDWLGPNALAEAEAIFGRHPQTGCVLLRVLYSYPDGRRDDYPMHPFTVMSGQTAFGQSLDWSIHGWYVARRELYERYPFDETCKAYSDDNTTRLHYWASDEVRLCTGIYYYRCNQDSVTQGVSVRRFDHLRANESMKRQLQQLGVGPTILAQYENLRWLVLIDVYMFYHVHGHQLSAAERRYGLEELHRVWRTIDRRLLNKKTTAKFGYRPCMSWPLFRWQEWLYFTLRGFLGRNL